MQLIELDGGLGPVWTARVIEAVGGRLPVGLGNSHWLRQMGRLAGRLQELLTLPVEGPAGAGPTPELPVEEDDL